MNIISLHTHIFEASAAPENDGFVWNYANRVPAFVGHPIRQIIGPLEIREKLWCEP